MKASELIKKLQNEMDYLQEDPVIALSADHEQELMPASHVGHIYVEAADERFLEETEKSGIAVIEIQAY